MGVVVSARHATLNQRVALKFLLPEACQHAGAVERFLREARAAVQIQSEHVARVSDVGTLETGAPYMVMEFLEGHDLAREIETRGPLPPEEATEFLLQACEAIAEAHALTIVHRDLKPANLFLSVRKDGSRLIKVLDFGISKAVQDGDANLTQTASMMGSPLYMAPEQIRNAKSVDARADVWSLGVILHECLSGTVPFDGETLSGVLAAIVADPPRPLSTLRPDLPGDLSSVVARCLEKDPSRRVQDVAELAELLAPYASQQAERSLPRIRSLLGRSGAAPRPSQARVGLEATVAGTTADEGRTAQPWATSGPRPTPKQRRWLLPATLVGGVLAAGAVGVVSLGNGPAEPAEATSEGVPGDVQVTGAAPSSATPTAATPSPTAPSAPAAASSAPTSAVAGEPPTPPTATQDELTEVQPKPAAEQQAPATPKPALAAPRPATAHPVATATRPAPTPTARPQSPAPATAPSPKAPPPSGDPLDGRR